MSRTHRIHGTSVSFLMITSLAAALLLFACGEGEPKPDPADQKVSPFSLSAVVKGATVKEVTAALATHIHTVDDTTRGLPANWLVAGGEELQPGHAASEAALKLPDGSRIVEVCNKKYAKMAMAFGGHHGVALPCEIAVTQKGADVEVVLLNPTAIFGLFFTDVPAEQAQGMAGLAATVRQELDGVVAAALANHNATHPRVSVGPTWTPQEMQTFSGMRQSITRDLSIPADQIADAEKRKAFKATVVKNLLETLTHEGSAKVGSAVAGLSVKDWRSAREHALGLPNGVSVVEVCSPTYARAALKAGAHHAPALPCQIAIWEDGSKVQIRVLDPNFIFSTFFTDAPEQMRSSMGPMVSNVRSDILKIVDAALAR